jgi:hypothetical protein
VASGCSFGGDITVPSGEDVDGGLEKARTSEIPLYFAGREFDGLPLTDVEVEGPGRALFAYGTCVIPAGGEGGCAVPIQIQIFPFRPSDWSAAAGCRRRPEVLDVPTVRHDGLVLFTRETVVKIYARSAADDRNVALSLRDVREPEKVLRRLPPPTPTVRQLQAAVCTKR